MPNWKKIIVSGSDASLSSVYIDGNLTASAAYLTSASIGHLETIYETASVIYSSGSTKFGDTSDDTHEITGSLLVTGSITLIDNGTGSFGRVEATTIDLDRLSLTSTQTTVPPLQLTANSLQDGVGALRIDGSQADIFLNPSTATHTTVTFAVNDDQKLAFGMDDNTDFYITRRNGGTWYDNTFTLSRTTGKLTLEGDLQAANITGSEISASLIGTASIADFATTASHTAGTASIANNAVTASHTAGTASIANTATTSSYTLTGDGIFSGSFSGSFAGDASNLNVNPFPFTGSGEMQGKLTVESFNDYIDDYADQYFAGTAIASSGDIALTGSIFSPYINADGFTGSLSGSFTGSGIIDSASLAETASFVENAQTASFYGGSVTSASLAETASFYGGSVTSASLAETASFVETAQTASYMTTGSFKQPVQFVKTEPATASLYHLHIMSASSAITMSLPEGTSGDWFKVSNMLTGSLLEAYGSQNIMSASGDLTLDTANAGLELIYTDDINGWVIIGN